MKFGLSDLEVLKIISVFKNYPAIEKAVIYGSRAKGNYKPGSDIDLTLLGAKLTLEDLANIASDLDDLLLPYTMDLSLHAKLSHPELLDHIRRIGLDFYVKS